MSPGGITKLICLTAMSCAEWMSTRGWLGCNKSDLHLFSHRMFGQSLNLGKMLEAPTGRTCGSFPKILMPSVSRSPSHAELQKDLMARRQDHNMYKHQVQNMWTVNTCCVVRPWYWYVVGEGFCCQNMLRLEASHQPSFAFSFFPVLWNAKISSSLFVLVGLLFLPCKPRSGSIATCGPTSRLRNVRAKRRWKSLNFLDEMVRKVAR